MSQDEVGRRLLPIHDAFHKGEFEDCAECAVLVKEFGGDSSGQDAIAETGAVVYDAPRRRMGRPPLPMPAKIDASPEEIARKVLNTPPPKGGWEYVKRRRDGRRGRK